MGPAHIRACLPSRWAAHCSSTPGKDRMLQLPVGPYTFGHAPRVVHDCMYYLGWGPTVQQWQLRRWRRATAGLQSNQPWVDGPGLAQRVQRVPPVGGRWPVGRWRDTKACVFAYAGLVGPAIPCVAVCMCHGRVTCAWPRGRSRPAQTRPPYCTASLALASGGQGGRAGHHHNAAQHRPVEREAKSGSFLCVRRLEPC